MADLLGILGLARTGGTRVQTQIDANEKNELLVAHGLPPYTEMARKGGGYSAMNTTALAALVVRPSTVANLTLFNNNASGGKSFIIDRAFAFNLVSTAAEARFGLWLCVHKPGLVSPTADITAIKSNVGNTGYAGGAVVDTGMTVIDDGWFPWGMMGDVEPTGTLPGGVISVEVAGRLIVPPTCGISTQVIASVVGNTFTTGFSWFEEKLSIE